MCGIAQRRSNTDYERSVFHHNRYEYLKSTTRIVVRLEYSGFYCVTIHAVND